MLLGQLKTSSNELIMVVWKSQAARKSGFPVLYGDGSRPAVLQTAGITMPKAVMVMYTNREKSVEAVERLRLAFPGVGETHLREFFVRFCLQIPNDP